MSESMCRPKKVEASHHTFTIHQPQIESWKGNEPERRYAVAMEQSSTPAPACGAIGLSDRTVVDGSADMVTIDGLRVTSANFPFPGK